MTNKILMYRNAEVEQPAGGLQPIDMGEDLDINDEQEEVEIQGTPPATEPAPPAVEAQPPATEPAPPAAEPTPPVAPVSRWQDEVKKQDKYEVMKELGYDEFTIGMLKYKDSTGDITPYVQAKTINYDEVDGKDLIAMDLKRAHPELSDKSISIMLNKKLEQYHLDRDEFPEGSDEAILGGELYNAEVKKLREKFKEEQNNFKAPENEQEKKYMEKVEKVNSSVKSNPAYQEFVNKKSVQVKFGEESFTVPIPNADEIASTAIDSIINASDRNDISAEELSDYFDTLCYAAHKKEYRAAFAAHLATQQKVGLQNELQNVKKPENAEAPDEGNLTPAQQLAREGKWTN